MNSPIRCEGLTKKFRGTLALDELQLEVPEGSIYALVGPNGAGKTTLMKILVNIFTPTRGHATILDTDSRKLSSTLFTQIGYVSENQKLPGWMTVQYFFDYLKPFYPTWDDALADQLIRELDLPKDRKLSQLSRGMRMKAALASSLAYHPRLILLDEPFGGLDVLMRDEFIEGLLERASNSTILISSHDLVEIESFASHIGFLAAGRLQLSEEIAALTGRFRAIEITTNQASLPTSNWPSGWFQPQTAASVVRFIDSQFDDERTHRTIRELFPEAAHVAISPMPLREIFVALARTARKAA